MSESEIVTVPEDWLPIEDKLIEFIEGWMVDIGPSCKKEVLPKD